MVPHRPAKERGTHEGHPSERGIRAMWTEQLESRRLFSVTASLGANDTLFVTGDDKGNNIKVELSDDAKTELVKVRTGSSATFTTIFSAPADKVKNLRVAGRGGDDHIDLSGASVDYAVVEGGHGSDWIMTG